MVPSQWVWGGSFGLSEGPQMGDTTAQSILASENKALSWLPHSCKPRVRGPLMSPAPHSSKELHGLRNQAARAKEVRLAETSWAGPLPLPHFPALTSAYPVGDRQLGSRLAALRRPSSVWPCLAGLSSPLSILWYIDQILIYFAVSPEGAGDAGLLNPFTLPSTRQ